jgi:hypothetical protein
MAEYKGIKGFKVQTVSTDPAASIIATGTWASGGDLNTARELLSNAGTTTASLAYGGLATTNVANTESWDGTSWTEVSDMNTARREAGRGGIYTSALGFGGSNPPVTNLANTESWDGTSWTEVADLATARKQLSGSGASNASALAFGGYTTTGVANTEEWTVPDVVINTLTTS